MTPAASSGDSAWACMALVAAAGTVACGPLAGQAAPRLRDAAAPGVVTVTAGTQYRAGWLHRALLGAHYRELWATPIQVEVLDLSRFGGGLTPGKRGGGRQTKSLRPHAADGRVYVFRSGAKDVAAAMPAKLWDRLTRDSRDRVDSRAFLAARLMDVFVGDWDRHPDQWRWARFDEGAVHVWRPIPRDRDQAFSRVDGLLPWLARYYHPDVVSFGDRYPDAVGLTWNGRALDRRLLTDIDKPVWDSVAAALQARLTDPVIDAAARRLPPEYYTRDGARLSRALKQRRDRLREMSDRYYALLADVVDVQATDDADLAEVERRGDGSVAVVLSRRNGPTYYARTFRPQQTSEVRLYLHGGDDHVVVRGGGRGGITVRVVTGAGNSEIVDSARGAGRNSFYLHRTPTQLITGPRTSIDRGAARAGPRADPT